MTIEPNPKEPIFNELLNHIKQVRQSDFAQVNIALIALYWSVEKIISYKVQIGAKVW